MATEVVGSPGRWTATEYPFKGWNEEREGPSTLLGTAGLPTLCNLSRIVTVKVGGAHRGRGLHESVVLRRPRQGLHPDERAALLSLMEQIAVGNTDHRAASKQGQRGS